MIAFGRLLLGGYNDRNACSVGTQTLRGLQLHKLGTNGFDLGAVFLIAVLVVISRLGAPNRK